MDFSPVQPPAEFPDKNYSVRWTGQLASPHTEDYTFRIQTDEGVRLGWGAVWWLTSCRIVRRGLFSGTAMQRVCDTMSASNLCIERVRAIQGYLVE